jgi:hypothetical protein
MKMPPIPSTIIVGFLTYPLLFQTMGAYPSWRRRFQPRAAGRGQGGYQAGTGSVVRRAFVCGTRAHQTIGSNKSIHGTEHERAPKFAAASCCSPCSPSSTKQRGQDPNSLMQPARLEDGEKVRLRAVERVLREADGEALTIRH